MEIIGWFVMTSGILNNSRKTLENNVVSYVTHVNKQINYSNTFSSSPYLITKLGTSNGGDPADTRIIQNVSNSFTVKI